MLRIALRTLLRRPSFTLIAILTLAVGIGATTAIFTVVDGVVLRPLGYDEADRLVRIQHPVPKLDPEWRWGVSEAGYFAMAESNETLSGLGAYSGAELVLSGGASAEKVTGAMVSASLFAVLGARPAAGRLLRPEDNEPGAASVVVLGHDFWQRQFGGDPDVVGRTIRIEGGPVEVVGVLEAGFDLPDQRTAVWAAVRISPENQPVNWHRFDVIGRLAEGVSAGQAEADLNRLVATFPERLPQAYGGDFFERTGFVAEVVPLKDHVVGGVRTALWVLMGAVGIVLLIGCVNVANLFLVRLESARRERAVRTALGASRWDIARQSLAESLLLGLAAGALGLFLAAWGVEALVRLGPDLPRLDQVGMTGTGVAFTVAVALLAGVVFGLMPAGGARVSFDALREGIGLTASRRRNAVRSGLVIGEMALALVLLVAAGLMIRTFQNLRSVDPGIEAEGVLAVDVSLPFRSYRGFEEVSAYFRRLTESAASLPGAVSAGATSHLPLGPSAMAGCSLIFMEEPEAQERGRECFASTVQATPGYFETMGIDVTGTLPGWEDVEARRGGIVVTGVTADRLWPGDDPMGKGLRGNGAEPPYYRVQAVTGPIRANGLDQPPIHEVYFPMLPMEGASLWSPPRSMTLVVRSADGRAAALAGPVQSLIRELDPDVAVGRVRPMTEELAESTARTSFAMLLLGLAAAVALILGVIGLYGVVSYVVEQRRAEIGIRMALGAREAEVRGMVVKQAARLAGLGVAVGGIGALLTSRLLAAQVYGVAPWDPVTLLATAALLTGVALAAAWLPARRAARVEPMGVLRGE